jgi:hypothetical protein
MVVDFFVTLEMHVVTVKELRTFVDLSTYYLYIYKRLKWFEKQHQVHKTK